MITGTLTLFNWSLRADVRSLWPHVVRAAFAGFMLISIAAALADSLTATGPGLLYFRSICNLNFLLIAVAGISYFVSAVTEEKDSGTLALLRLAGVAPLQIILGKSTSRLVSSLMLLGIQLPFTFLAITLGGVTWQQILAAYLLLAGWMAFVANLSLFCSVRCRTAGRAAGMASSVLLLLLLFPGIVSATVPTIPPPLNNATFVAVLQSSADWLKSVSVLQALDQILAPTSGNIPLLDRPVIWHAVGAAILFLASVLMFDFWLIPVEPAESALSLKFRRYSVGRCWRLPVVWKDFLFFTGGRPFLLVKFLAYGGLIAAAVAWQRIDRGVEGPLLQGDYAWVIVVTLFTILNAEVMLYASGSLFSEVRQTTLSSLAMLPFSTPRLLLEKLGATLMALLPVIFWTVVVCCMDLDAVASKLSATMIVTGLFVLLLNSHLTVLLSLYTRWGALPLALLLTASALTCCPLLVLPVFGMADWVARSHNLQFGLLLGAILNVVWGWLFLLLPMELEIVNRWNRLSQSE